MVDYVNQLIPFKQKLIELKTIKKMKETQLFEIQEASKEQEIFLVNAEKARLVCQTVASEIQKDLEYQISNIVTLALTSVGFSYQFKTQFVERRNQTECDMFFVKDGNEVDDLFEGGSGFGAIDVASIALRMAYWSIKKTRALLILDEPSRDLSRDMQEKCSEMIKMLSTELGIQIIVVSHIPELIESADRIINVTNENGYSTVKVIK